MYCNSYEDQNPKAEELYNFNKMMALNILKNISNE